MPSSCSYIAHKLEAVLASQSLPRRQCYIAGFAWCSGGRTIPLLSTNCFIFAVTKGPHLLNSSHVTAAGKLGGTTNIGEVASHRQLHVTMPPLVIMCHNKICVSVGNVTTLALVDMGASASIISMDFKTQLGRKVMFQWDNASTFRAVSGELLRPLGVCISNGSLSDNVYQA